MTTNIELPHRKTVLNLADAARALTETWSARVAGQVNDILLKVARVEGDFIWHDHPDTDEGFLVLEGQLVIDLRDAGPGDAATERSIVLEPFDFYVIPRGIFHRPHSDSGATIALFEAAGTVNTGRVGGELTSPVDRPLD